MNFSTTPNVAARGQHGLAKYARQAYYMEHNDVRVAWETPELMDYFND